MRLVSAKFLGYMLALLVLAVATQPAEAGYTYSFEGITNNKIPDIAAGELQLRVDVLDAGSGKVSFKFYHVGASPKAMSITDVYFDDGSLLVGITSITSSTGVSFTGGSSSPGELPGGNAINFNTTAGFLADSNAPAQPNGVNPGEWLTITFNLINGKTYADTITALSLSLANPGVDMTNGLRIGIHVQGFARGGSEAFINGEPGPSVTAIETPAPAGLVLLASAMPFAFGLRRWLNRRVIAA